MRVTVRVAVTQSSAPRVRVSFRVSVRVMVRVRGMPEVMPLFRVRHLVA